MDPLYFYPLARVLGLAITLASALVLPLIDFIMLLLSLPCVTPFLSVFSRRDWGQ